ncbi:DUF4395 domain-containing protein [Halalkalibacter akibai]|uniref:DUF4395 domain-containing protein n=1 Tax=Halalkalibacter akibai (strain ATCC 43226 / DSM 21942 / CIP 109018 / JCM 9157 / 1139) TaxID=1236973 RepID=W4QQU0_HALA3|nr:DUF4395 domain-containing protein [Halalkalibacter akibai]GAE34302.1 hypothetical protein JCM9157_1349 [Halalkalibacter akibai JCM 9157]
MGIPKPLVQINQLFIVVTTIMGLILTKYILFLPFIIGALALATNKNIIMILGKGLLRKPKNLYIQEDKAQQQFNQWIATICLGISILSFVFGFEVLGYLFSIMVIVAAGVALLGFCIGCTIRFRYLMWKHKRTS